MGVCNVLRTDMYKTRVWRYQSYTRTTSNEINMKFPLFYPQKIYCCYGIFEHNNNMDMGEVYHMFEQISSHRSWQPH